MAIGAIVTSMFPKHVSKIAKYHTNDNVVAFFFGYTQIKNQDSNVALSCVIGFVLNIYYGTL